jgi:hypothetical protein
MRGGHIYKKKGEKSFLIRIIRVWDIVIRREKRIRE